MEEFGAGRRTDRQRERGRHGGSCLCERPERTPWSRRRGTDERKDVGRGCF